MKFSDFARRDDLCCKGQTKVLYCPDKGAIIKVGNRWYASNDTRRELVGVEPNENLAQPTVGPFKSAQDAFSAYAEAAKTEAAA